MRTEFTEWEEQLLAGLVERARGHTLQAMADRWGVDISTVGRLMAGERGIGARVLEQLRRAEPDLVAGVFANGCEEDPAPFLPEERTIDPEADGAPGQVAAGEVEPCSG